MDLAGYLSAFAHLRKAPRPDSPLTLRKQPHKPLLLLSVLDLIAGGYFDRNRFYLSPELNDIFDRYWHVAVPSSEPGNIRLPFEKLVSDGFWHFTGEEHPITRSRLARFDDELFLLASNAIERAALQEQLILSHFAPEIRDALRETLSTTEEAAKFTEERLRHIDLVREEPPPAIRSQAFRAIVVRAYEYRCAMCGIRIFSPEGRTAVEAAHIRPWSESHDDEPDNGLALCRLCHWTFDAGLLSVSDNYTVLTSSRLRADKNLGGHLITMSSRAIILPLNDALQPAKAKLAFHRATIFVG